jgi:hypothetical protein
MDDRIESILLQYVREIRDDLKTRWESWPLDLAHSELHEVVGALLARQVTLASNFARAPGVWNDHIAPVILRCMADVYISLAWILEDPVDRSKKYILYGLGQTKLQVEHRKAQMESNGEDPSSDPLIEPLERWMSYQRYPFLTEVNIGSWSGLDTRQMAEQAGCLDFYRYVYTPFSASVHSTWYHVGRLNLEPCTSLLHRAHNLPIDPDAEIDPHYLMLAAKYLDKAFHLFDTKMLIDCPPSEASAHLAQMIETLDSKERETESEPPAPT